MIDVQGRVLAIATDSLYHMAVLIDPLYDSINMLPKERHRLELIHITQSHDMKILGITLKNSSN